MKADKGTLQPVPSALRRLGWPVHAVLGVIGGILLGLGQPWGVVPILLGLVLSWKRWLPAALCLLATLAGYGALHLQMAQPDRMAPWVGANITVQGEWDGQFLALEEPKARIAVSPKPQAPPGWLKVQGRLVRPDGRRLPGGFDQRAWLRAQGGLFVPAPTTVLVGTRVIQNRSATGLKGHFRRGLVAGLPPRLAALMQAIELGDRNDIGREQFTDSYSIRDGFNRSGLAHLMALSGQNIALITGALILLLGTFRLPLRWRYGLAMVVVLAYLLLLVNASPSITRASIMGLAVLAGLAIGRGRPDALSVISLAALVSLLLFPLWITDIGFQLSFLAVLALTLTGKLADRLPQRWPYPLRLAIAAPVLAELGTLPVIASNFGQLPLVGLPANLLAEVIMVVLVPLGFLAGLLGPWGGLVNWLVAPLASLLLALVAFFGQAPTLGWGKIGAGGYLAYLLFALAAAAWLQGRVRGQAVLLVLLAVTLLTTLPAWLRPERSLIFLDVGQGDATLLRTRGLTMLVDGGGSVNSDYDVGTRTVAPALRALGVHRIDVMVATHADTDHIEGLSGVMGQLPVGELWIGHRKLGDPVLAELLAAAADHHVPVREVRRGDHISADDLSVTVLWPKSDIHSTADNENSVALRIESGEWRAALLGDLPDPTESLIGVGNLDLLKAAHHGSRFSTSAALLKETTPSDVVISVGRNLYGHPNADVLDRIRQAGARVWRTDQQGTISWPLP